MKVIYLVKTIEIIVLEDARLSDDLSSPCYLCGSHCFPSIGKHLYLVQHKGHTRQSVHWIRMAEGWTKVEVWNIDSQIALLKCICFSKHMLKSMIASHIKMQKKLP